MDSSKRLIVFAVFCVLKISAEPPLPQGIRPSNVLGGAEQHASFSFVRPGLTQTSYSFNGPSSHQAFSSSIGNPSLAQKVLPNVASALAYRNPGLGYFSNGPITTAYASPTPQYQQAAPAPPPAQHAGQVVYQGTPLRPSEGQVDQATALAYLQQQFQQQYRQQYQQQLLQAQQQQYLAQNSQAQGQSDASNYQAQLAQLQAIRQAQTQAQTSEQLQQLPEQIQLQQQEQHQQQQTQNLLGVAYSSAPSVAHVKVNGNGYNFDF